MRGNGFDKNKDGEKKSEDIECDFTQTNRK